MDSMDWFDPSCGEAAKQVQMLYRSLKVGGKVLLRSAALRPWYSSLFEEVGFVGKRVDVRHPGSCIDRSFSQAITPSHG